MDEQISKLMNAFGKMEDPTDLCHKETIHTFMNSIQEEDNDFMELITEKLENKTVNWYQPWYQTSPSLTRCIKGAGANETETYRKDTITKAESDDILNRWLKLIKKHDIPNKLGSLARWKNKNKAKNKKTPEERVRRYVTAYVARNLNRTLPQVFKHICIHFGCPVKGPYAPIELAIMKSCFHHFPRDAVKYLSIIFGREPRAIYIRYQHSIKGKPELKQKLKWTLPLASKFLKYLLKYKQCSLEELKDQHIQTAVFDRISKHVDQNGNTLRKFWYNLLHVQLFVKKTVLLKKLRKRIFKQISSRPYKVWSDIRWKELLDQFPDGFTAYFLYRVAYRLITDYPNYLKCPIEELVSYALDKNRKDGGKRLRNLVVNKEGQLEQITYFHFNHTVENK